MTRFAAPRTCDECPWRRDVAPGRFPPTRYVVLAASCIQGLENPIFACHKSPDGKEYACAGFLLVEGFRNIRVRLMAHFDKFDIKDIKATGPLYGSYREMAEANGVRPNHPALKAIDNDRG